MDCDGKDFQRRKNKNNADRDGVGPVAGRWRSGENGHSYFS